MVADLAFFRSTMPESSALATGADDALKDLDNTWFLRGQPEDVRAAWFERIGWLRWVDHLVERDRCGFAAFLRQWRQQWWFASLDDGPYESEAGAIWTTWFAVPDLHGVTQGQAAHAWDSWLDALAHDYGRTTVPVTVEDHDAMLGGLSGAMFALLPYVRAEDRNSIWHFGILDGFFNNLRDLAEDSAAGLCYFPADALERHGLTRDDVLTGRCIGTVGWERMMTWWLDDYLPTLRERAAPFIEATGLHPSLEALRGWCLHRYRRVEGVFREVGYDYRAFQLLYWARVREELAERSDAA